MSANFNTMMMAANVLQGFMNSPDFFQFGFRFEQNSSTGIYFLKCAAFKADKTISNPDVTMTIYNANAISLNFNFKSVLIVSKATLSTNGFNGTQDMYLIPLQSGGASPLPYVSYLINDQATMDGSLAVTGFSMNPSPPYKSQN